jgi:hypothetical protein
MKLTPNGDTDFASIIHRAERSIEKIDESFLAIARWNRLHPEEAPIDPDPDGELAAIKKYAEALIQECRRPRRIGEPLNIPAPLPNSVKEKIHEIQKGELKG